MHRKHVTNESRSQMMNDQLSNSTNELPKTNLFINYLSQYIQIQTSVLNKESKESITKTYGCIRAKHEKQNKNKTSHFRKVPQNDITVLGPLLIHFIWSHNDKKV